jgi:TonB family protein
MPQSSNVLSFVSPEPLRPWPAPAANETDETLRRIAEAALSATGASGAALALRKEDAVVCLARAGEMAPPLGSRLDDRSGMSGECLRTGQALRCEDTDTDGRVDGAACRALGLRALAVAPVKNGEQVVGILEVFSARPAAFTERHMDVLRQLAELVLEDSGADPNEKPTPASQHTASPAPMAAPVPVPLPPPPAEAMQVLGRKAPTVSSAPPPAFSASSPATANASLPAATATSLGSTAKRPSASDVNIAAYMAADATAHSQTKPRVPYPVLIGLAVFVVACVVGWWSFHHTAADASTQPTPAPVTASVATIPETAALPKPAGAKPNPATSVGEPDDLNTKSKRESLTKAASLDRIESASREVTKPIRVVSPEPTSPSDSDTAPALAGLGTANAKGTEVVSSLLTARVSVPQRATPISQGVTPGEIERKINAVYPAQARSVRQQGTVVLQALITEEGSVKDVTVVSGPPLLRQAASDAVKQWKYKPYRLNGQPVAIQTQIKVEFKMQ